MHSGCSSSPAKRTMHVRDVRPYKLVLHLQTARAPHHPALRNEPIHALVGDPLKAYLLLTEQTADEWQLAHTARLSS